ncbi:MAG: hypothetical protein JWP37_815 [Mucilaginibacter sp.]|nr:hypothetical protein [Mucilaginibacter sp.]
MKKEKLDAFTDAVVAIIITLMVLEIKLPQVTAANLWEVLRHIGIYALSFVVIGITWLNYNTFFKYIDKITPRIIWINMAFLFLLSLIPLPTQALGEAFFLKESHIFYGVILTAVAASYSLMYKAATRYIGHLSKAEIKILNRKNWMAVGFYALSIPLSLVSIYLSTAVFIIMPAIYFIPSKKLIEETDQNPI